MICRFDIKTCSQQNLTSFLACLSENWIVEETWDWWRPIDGKTLWTCRIKKAGKDAALVRELQTVRKRIGLDSREIVITELEPIKDLIKIQTLLEPYLKKFLHCLPRGWKIKKRGRYRFKDRLYYALLEGDKSKRKQLDQIKKELGLEKAHCDIIILED